MSKLSRFVIGAVVLAVAWNLGPVKARRGQVRHALQAGTDVITGKDAVDIGQDVKRQQVRSALQLAIREYWQLNGEDPRSLQDLVAAGLLQSADLADEWGRPLVTERGQEGLVIRSLGSDGQRGTEDDWTLGH